MRNIYDVYYDLQYDTVELGVISSFENIYDKLLCNSLYMKAIDILRKKF
jgi:hypothetical protein